MKPLHTWINDAGRLTSEERRYDLNHWQRFGAALRRCGRALEQSRAIFEFGCGRGRLLRHLPMVAPQASLSGCDIGREEVARSRRHCPQAVIIHNAVTPPLSLRDEHFDLIYSYSVFTHLSEPNHLAWLKELTRLLKPGGVMFHTTHSIEALWRLATFSPERLPKYQLSGPLPAFLESAPEYYYAVDNPATPEYGLALISESYLSRVWPEQTGLRLRLYQAAAIEAYPEGCQDLVVLEKPGREAAHRA